MITIRHYTDADYLSMRALDASVSTNAADGLKPMSKDLQTTMDRKLLFLVAVDSEEPEKVLGMMALRQPDEDLPTVIAEGRPKLGELTNLRVSTALQGQGIGGIKHRIVVEVSHPVRESFHSPPDGTRFKTRILIGNCPAPVRHHDFEFWEILEHG